jgi:hypothetical protein
VRHIFPADGEYKLAARLFRGIEEGYIGVEGNDTPNTFVITIDGDEVFSTTIGGPKDHEEQGKSLTETKPLIDARMTARVKVTAGPHDVGFTWRERPAQRQDVWQPARRDSQEVHMVGGMPKIGTAMIEGPYNVTGVSDTPSRDRIFVCRPASAAEEAPCAERIFTNLTRRAYRRPVTGDDVQAPLAFYRQTRQSGETFDAGIRAGLARVLSSPSFLYRMESDPAGIRPGTAHQVSEVDLASRLSFFLWSSIPDERLLNLATSGRLRQPGVLAAQVKRMIEDRRADALISNFTGQWLQLRNIEAKVTPDILTFPDFDDNIRKGFRRETETLFGYILRNDRSAMELLSADYTFLNERLAKHYGIANVSGPDFRRVELTTDQRGGVFTQASVLTVSSYPTRTSVVLRGKYLLETALNAPPPPPPGDVPPLDEKPIGVAVSHRSQLEAHRTNPICASCHNKMDPLGFGLENYDAVGRWRTTDGTIPIDATGTFPGGKTFSTPAELKALLRTRMPQFTRGFAERMLTYALGRGVEPYDRLVVRDLVAKTAADDYQIQALVQAIVASVPFQERRGQ